MSRNVTKTQLVNEIRKVITSTAISIDVETEVRMRKTDNPYFGATKRNRVAGLIGFDYENSVNNQLGREEKTMDFVAQEHKWAKPTDSRNLLTNEASTKLYLRLKVQSASHPVYSFNGREISKDLLVPFIPITKKPNTQANLDKEIIVRTYDMDNIKSVRMLGDEFVVTHTITEAETTPTELTRETQTA